VEASVHRREAGQEAIDWEAIERSPEFQELTRRRRAFVLPATIFFLAWYMGFILLVAYAEDFMSKRVYEGLTVGYCLALTQFVMVVVLGLTYLRKSESEFDPLAEKAIEGQMGHRQRFARGDAESSVGSRAATPSQETTS
jgi:uncharacterized membrane protein (DUF485 family)